MNTADTAIRQCVRYERPPRQDAGALRRRAAGAVLPRRIPACPPGHRAGVLPRPGPGARRTNSAPCSASRAVAPFAAQKASPSRISSFYATTFLPWTLKVRSLPLSAVWARHG